MSSHESTKDWEFDGNSGYAFLTRDLSLKYDNSDGCTDENELFFLCAELSGDSDLVYQFCESHLPYELNLEDFPEAEAVTNYQELVKFLTERNLVFVDLLTLFGYDPLPEE